MTFRRIPFRKTPMRPGDREVESELDRVAVSVLNMLLARHSVLRSSGRQSRPAPSERFSKLLEGYLAARGKADSSELAGWRASREMFEGILTGHESVMQSYRRSQEQCADDFNILEVMQLTYKEIRHSMVLAWLLDHDLRRLGTHAQGSLGFRLFLTELNLPASYADCQYTVHREVAGDDSIVDIEVACRGRFLIHIENKIRAREGMNQTHREWSDLRRRAEQMDIDGLGAAPHIHALFLTPSASGPLNAHFRAIGWGSIARVLDEFADLAKPDDVRLFASHYARALRQFIVSEAPEQENGSEESAE